ncbi:hypothetical protein CAI21_17635 [Alkalilimnicola ehrlichii]|uniref:Uncharacterized protein n=1 Tax=Alkalilimnicola ehrlichii TaxID=351052 RepID=A0A3E0WHB4_9GAMM|nr:hypothetical protein CAI21_17635 [Alkalilimnicola ehrlichii]RFA32352.1 hypothetical protein CAL65_19905 [Alkalilimnicola ehrlichii]
MNGVHQLSNEFDLIGEAYGTHRGGTEFQLGLRYNWGPAVFDLGYGWVRSDSDDDWYTVGFAWAF